MTIKEFSLLVKKEYKEQNGQRFFTEKALVSALLEKWGFSRFAPLENPGVLLSKEQEEGMKKDLFSLLYGFPLQYSLGTQYFCGLEFSVSPGVLIPRPETEILVELGAKYAPENSLVFDFCCGSGCVGLSLLKKREDLFCHLYDLSPFALKQTRENRKKLDLCDRSKVEEIDILSPCAKREVESLSPSLILSNPPYLTKKEMDEIPDNVKNEPEMALFGGEDGLLFYKRLISLSKETGVPILCEMGAEQKAGVEKLLLDAGMKYEFYRDLSGLDRGFFAR